MSDITILSNHLGIQGSYLNILDFQHYLQTTENLKVLFYTNDFKELMHVTRGSRRPYKFDEVKLLKQYEPNSNAIIVTDFKTLIKLFKDNMRIVCRKLIIMDNNELSYHLNDMRQAKFFHRNLNINRLLKPHKFNEVEFLFPKSNEEKFSSKYPDIPYTIFYKKISWNLLKEIPVCSLNRLFYRFDDINVKEQMIKKYGSNVITFDEYMELDLWKYKGLIYYRRKHLDYYEQLGRLIFEFIMVGKEVHFLKDPFEVDDGLSDYLNYYAIEFDDDYTVLNSPENLINKMETEYKYKPWEII